MIPLAAACAARRLRSPFGRQFEPLAGENRLPAAPSQGPDVALSKPIWAVAGLLRAGWLLISETVKQAM